MTLRNKITNYLTEVGVPGVGYAVNWEKVSDKLLSLFIKEALKKFTYEEMWDKEKQKYVPMPYDLTEIQSKLKKMGE